MKYVKRYAILMIVVQFILVAFFMAGLDKKNKNYIVSSLKTLKTAVDSHYDWTSKSLEDIPSTITEDDPEAYNDDTKDEEYGDGAWSGIVSFSASLYLYVLHAISGCISAIQLAIMPVGVIHNAFNYGIYEKAEEAAATFMVSILTAVVTAPIGVFHLASTSLARFLGAVIHGFVGDANSIAVGLVSRTLANVIVLAGLLQIGRPLFNVICSILSYFIRAPLACVCPCFQWKLLPSCSWICCPCKIKKEEGGEDISETEDETETLANKKRRGHSLSPTEVLQPKERSYVVISDND